MRWADVNRYRSEAAAGVFIALTRKCPLHCAHCSTNSTMGSPASTDNYYINFVRTFTDDCHPRFAWFTGGEPLLRPDLVETLANGCRRVGTAPILTTGLYFGKSGKMPEKILSTLKQMDLVTVSVDRWHEVEVARSATFSCFDTMLANRISLGIQVTLQDENDSYIRQLLSEIESRFGTAISVFVSVLKPTGRGADLIGGLTPGPDEAMSGSPKPQGCGGLSWPVFGFGGSSSNACCNQEAVDEQTDHLALATTWPEIVTRLRTDPVMKVLNVLGPRVLASELGQHESKDDFCTVCRKLASNTGTRTKAIEIVERPSWHLYENLVSGLRAQQADPTLEYSEFATQAGWGT